jgi:hypothetical protein
MLARGQRAVYTTPECPINHAAIIQPFFYFVKSSAGQIAACTVAASATAAVNSAVSASETNSTRAFRCWIKIRPSSVTVTWVVVAMITSHIALCAAPAWSGRR